MKPFTGFGNLDLKPGDKIEVEFGGGAVPAVVEHLNKIGQPYVKRLDGKTWGVNEGKYIWDELVRKLEA